MRQHAARRAALWGLWMVSAWCAHGVRADAPAHDPTFAPERQVLVVYTEASGADEALSGELARTHGLELVEHRHLRALGTDSALFRASSSAERDARVAALAGDRRVQVAQAVQILRVAGEPRMPPKDPYFDLQVRTRPGGVSTLLQQGSGRGVRIAIIDTGVDLDHPDLLGQIADARNFVGSDARAIPPEFHGTAVTGLIAAHAGNGVGIHGSASNATVYSLRACWEPTYGYGICSSYTLAQALDYAIDVRARIINLSLAGPADPILTQLVERAVELGAVVFGAIGEEPDLTFPTAIPDVIAVEQTRQGSVQVPGERLTVPGLQLLTTVPGGRYDFVSGPSFATAHASGVAAVMLELEPRLSAHNLADWLRRLHENPDPPPRAVR